MTKQQKLGACFGGAFGVVALALGWFFYSAYADRQTGDAGLTAEDQKNEGFYKQSNPFPSAEAIATVESNKAEFVKWRAEALKVAASGDCPKMSERMDSGSTFKTKYLQAKVNEMVNLKISSSDFLFGFEQYLGQDNRTTPDPKDFQMLYAQLTTIAQVVDVFKRCGVSQIRAIKREQGGVSAEQPEEPSSRRRKKAAKDRTEKAPVVPKPYDYRFDFVVHPSALLEVLNELAKSPRFYVVSEFGFEREGESLMARLGRTSEKSSGGKSPNERTVEGGDVVNPESDLVLAHMKLSVFDFGKRSGSQNAEAAAEPQKEGK